MTRSPVDSMTFRVFQSLSINTPHKMQAENTKITLFALVSPETWFTLAPITSFSVDACCSILTWAVYTLVNICMGNQPVSMTILAVIYLNIPNFWIFFSYTIHILDVQL